MSRRFIVTLFALVLCIGIMPYPVAASGQPLPPLPSQTIIDSVLAQTNGAQFTPMYAPNSITTQLATFTGVFQNIYTQLDMSQAVNYLNAAGTLRETVIPMLNSGSLVLDPDITAPGAIPRPGKIIGALFQPSRGTFFVVAIFKAKATTCPSCYAPDKVRFYYNSTQYYEDTLNWGEFLDPNGDQILESVDQGAIIAYKYTCVTMGMEQGCWDPYDYDEVRQKTVAKNKVRSAYEDFKAVYDFDVKFYLSDALPDLLGYSQRTACAQQLINATTYNDLSSCLPNLFFTASKEVIANQPMALFVITQPADIRTYDMNGNFVGALPVGSYLVIDATPSVTTPGQAALVFLVNLDTVNHYLIPSVAVQGFSQSTAILDKRYAALKDGLAGYRGFGQ